MLTEYVEVTESSLTCKRSAFQGLNGFSSSELANVKQIANIANSLYSERD